MRVGTLIPAFAACFAVLIFAGPQPSAAMPASAALAYAETNAGVVQDVGNKKYWNKRYRYRGYGNRNYYRPYAYNRPYYRPYAYYRPYGYGYYPYHRRPGVSLWFGW